MAIVNEIKCARCDRKYSGVRSRCPYCGARRIGRGKYSDDSGNAKGKMLISVLIMAVFAVGAGILLFTTHDPAEAQDDDNGNLSISGNPEDDTSSLPALPIEPTPTPTPVLTPEPVAPLVIDSITITYSGAPLRDGEFTMRIGEAPIPLNIRVEPPGAESGIPIVWSSSNPDVFDVVETPGMGGLGADVHAIGRGDETLTVTIGDVSTTCIVRIRGGG